jgi:hypothetical protein
VEPSSAPPSGASAARALSLLTAQMPDGIALRLECSEQDTALVLAMIETDSQWTTALKFTKPLAIELTGTWWPELACTIHCHVPQQIRLLFTEMLRCRWYRTSKMHELPPELRTP